MVLKEWVGISQTELLGIIIADRDAKTLRWEIDGMSEELKCLWGWNIGIRMKRGVS